jgi:hypothetical protein
MTTNRKPARWLLLAAHVGTILFLMACAVFSGAQLSDDGLFQISDGSIEIQDENGDWVPVNGVSFEMVGELESTDPWTVAGRELETNDSTSIEEELEVGDLVRVRGIITDDETWVAYSIESTDEQTDPIIILIGVVDSIDPWSVNGISLNVTDETEIQGDITVGTIVRVEILLLEDGTWEVLSIAPLGEFNETSDCVTVVATIVSVEGNEILFLGWPATLPLDIPDDDQGDEEEEGDNDEDRDEQDEEDENEGEENEDENDAAELTLEAGQVVLAVVCVSEDGQLIIVQITLLEDNDGDESDGLGNGEKVLICHKPDKNPHTLSIASPAVPAHLAHGDILGPCP